MYLSQFHIFVIFAAFVVYIFSQFLIIYFFKEKNKLYTFSFTLIIFVLIFGYSTLLTIDSFLKSVELRNQKDYKSANEVVISGQIYNNGKVPVKTCELNIGIINLGIKKVDGSIFDLSKGFDPLKLNKIRNFYSHDFKIEGIINENASKSFKVSVPYPKHFEDYKLRYILNCK
ncbi:MULTISPECIES: DUF2393 family protein [unclassified Campylobacter]|uniref:DUF2393 family protein n=1 Tax=unclassified Campylobacter TaxID=2593542 RepID=UPI001BDA8081|nr:MULTISPECIES: DUF2393 family protein [unclassified Campylobacter]MBZ7976624.1 DUF2393 family protein [Campylobacter sp. RM12637]MBZ7978637.1 DUF2393 family protein [Campylobacter sp. RM12654]MBZ7980702.1 DUF2393 family protein [Campylobacter sp. RM12642]MBZ7982556.1 DUF2393 family protein [Campylobacter sp. RM12640]MBZ7984602.1 DUF2393 family protein [Campylobacter sp. RM12647]MBZ7989799.1 DUF2393 family protein [Campylobacter sp. RM12635]MBZ7993260.1 DUF2393 family protein [Campylobacter